MYHSYPSILLYKIENSHTDFTESFLICLGIKTVTSETGNEYSERDNKEWKAREREKKENTGEVKDATRRKGG